MLPEANYLKHALGLIALLYPFALPSPPARLFFNPEAFLHDLVGYVI